MTYQETKKNLESRGIKVLPNEVNIENILGTYSILIPKEISDLYEKYNNKDTLLDLFILSSLDKDTLCKFLYKNKVYESNDFNIQDDAPIYFYTNRNNIDIPIEQYLLAVLTDKGQTTSVEIYSIDFEIDSNSSSIPITPYKTIYIPNKCFINTQTEVSYIKNEKIDYPNITTSLVETLRRKYQCVVNNVRFTNEITDKTKIITIADKNILRTFERNYYCDSPIQSNQVLLNPNLQYFASNLDKQIPIPHLLALFDYDEKEVLKTLKKVSYLTNPIVSLGFGGLMTNFFFWCKRLQDYFNLDYIFKNVHIYDPDSLEIDNLFRIPLNWKDIKIKQPINDIVLTKLFQEPCYKKKFYKISLFESITSICQKYRLNNIKFPFYTLKNSILIGGVDLETRIKLRQKYLDSDTTYICASHYNNITDITIFPDFDPELVVETYGTINLNNFLLSMFKMTIEMLKLLASKDIYADNKTIMRWDIENEDFITNSKKSKTLKDIAYVIN